MVVLVNNLFGEKVSEEEANWYSLSKKQKQEIERAKLKKLGEANYFYPTKGKNIFHTDGFVLGINGVTDSGGFTVFKNGELITSTNVVKGNKKTFTNNEGELLGVLKALELAEFGDEIMTDSMNTLAWVRSGNPKARPDLIPLAQKAKALLHLKEVNFYWAPREENEAGNYNEFEK